MEPDRVCVESYIQINDDGKELVRNEHTYVVFCSFFSELLLQLVM